LSLAAREANIVSINIDLAGVRRPDDPNMWRRGTTAHTRRRVAWVREAAGERFDTLELQTLVYATSIAEDTASRVTELANRFAMQEEEVLEIPHFLVGPPPRICDTLRQRRAEFGFSYIVVLDDVIDDFAPVVRELTGT
jgi:hypothetical protein